MNVNIKIVFLDFSKTTIWTYVVYDLDGSIARVRLNGNTIVH